MTTIVTRAGKGSALTHNEVDSNFINLNNAKYESGNNATFGTVGATTITGTSFSNSGNLTFTGTGNRITGDFSNGTVANRVAFQNSVTNGATNVTAFPNGTGVNSSYIAYNNSDPSNASAMAISVLGSTDVRLQSFITGTGTYLPMTFYTGGSERMRIDTSGNVGIGISSLSYNFTTVKSSAGIIAGFYHSGSTGGGSILKVTNGYSSTSPVYAFWFNDNTGIGNPAADTISFINNATERMRIDSSGNVGIGAASNGNPKLQVWQGSNGFGLEVMAATSGPNNGASIVRLLNSTNTVSRMELNALSDNYSAISVPSVLASITSGSERMRIGSDGSISVGTTDTTSWGNGFTVYNKPITGVRNFGGSGSVNFMARALGTAQGQLAGYTFYPTFVGTGDSGPRRAADIWSGFNGGNWGTQYLAFGVGNAANDAQNTTPERMRIDSSGNVAIGTSSAGGFMLNVLGSFISSYATINSRATTNDFVGISITNQRSTGGVSFIDAQGINSVTDSHIFFNHQSDFGASISFATQPAGTNTDRRVERMRIDSSGNLLVGTTSALARFVVVASSNSTYSAQIRSDTSGDVAQAALLITKADNNSTTSQVFQRFAINVGGTANGQINANGASQVAFGSWSDARLKENIVDLPPQLNNITSLRPVEFDYKDGSGHQVGFIAQEMQEVYPDAVGKNSDGYLTITGWDKTTSRLVKAIQELKAELDVVKSELNTLKGN